MLELAVVVPTFNEQANIRPFLDALSKALTGIDFEVIFVDDDSPDDTAGLVRSIGQYDSRVRVLQRINRRGLASATVEGMMATSAPYVAVMDADLQHDERILPEMYNRLKTENLDVVIGSRNIAGGGMGEFASYRVALSNAGRALSRMVCRASLSDPMSGFFCVSRTFLDETVRSLSSRGFKILLDLVASSSRPVRFAEVPFTFRQRLHGQSKLDILVGLEYLELLIDKVIGDWIPVTYLLFAAVGSVGVVLHLTFVALLLRFGGLSFSKAQVVSSSVVIAVNYFLNNYLTFHSSRLRGLKLIYGLVLFYIASAVGLLINLGASRMLRANGLQWWIASAVGLIVGSVWNYWVTSLFVWRMNRRRARGRVARVKAMISASGVNVAP
jgi:dolichol-phosphate mannosyltransferase